MNESLHIVCPHCHTTNRVLTGQLGSAPACGQCKRALFAGGREVARQPGALGMADIVRWVNQSMP